MNARPLSYEDDNDAYYVFLSKHAIDRIDQRAWKIGWSVKQLVDHVCWLVSKIDTGARVPADDPTPGYARYRCKFSVRIDEITRHVLIVFEEDLRKSIRIRIIVTIYLLKRVKEKPHRRRRKPN